MKVSVEFVVELLHLMALCCAGGELVWTNVEM